MAPTLPAIVLNRCARRPGVEWRNARSWLGGAPRLGAASWPRQASGEPMHFVAQLDLAEIAAKAPETPLPKHGALAFFVGGEGATLFVPDHMSAPPAEPPAEMGDLSTVGGNPDWLFDEEGRALFPFWPVDVTRIDLDTPETGDPDEDADALSEAYVAALRKRFARRQYDLSPTVAFEGPPIPDWWRCAFHVADSLAAAARNAPNVIERERGMIDYARGKLDEARRAGAEEIEAAQRQAAGAPPPPGGLRRLFGFGRQAQTPARVDIVGQARRKAAAAIRDAEASVALYEAKIAKMRDSLPAFNAFADELAAWTQGHDPWSVMGPEDCARLDAYWARMTEFPEHTVHYGRTPVDYLKSQMFARLPKPGDAGFEALPEHVRTVIAGRCAPRPQWWRSTIRFADGMEQKLAEGEPLGLRRKRESLISGGAAQAEALARLNAQAAAFQHFVGEFVDWAKGRDPWSRMTGDEAAILWERLKRLQRDFGEIAREYYFQSFDRIEAATLVAVASAPDEIYETMPQDARDLINRDYLLPIDFMHQMFGPPAFIQGDSCAQAEEGKLLLLQLGFDDLMFWSFGDNGDYQFWISPEDLATGKWDRVTMTFECH
ncbi:MAG: hypothetical protein CTY15_09120 [Methylocystis sp.]|nr:MAG: hypothetical protein CTY15_09120 [Methylocystis sp.]